MRQWSTIVGSATISDIICHAIDTLAKEGKVEKVSEYVANLSEYHKKGRSQGTLFCKNTVINALLQYYEDNAGQSEIKTVIRVSADENLPVPEVEFCIIIGNLLENAIDASRTLARGKRKIEFYGKQEGAMYPDLVCKLLRRRDQKAGKAVSIFEAYW